ncbi:MAG: 5-formyltetrahydrofolate cyclo-ligase, partial [Clostridiales bacterium]|nr:5-formyltetrahydrofolate cyclo-ligase [Clostridiales bacterium]
TRAFLQILWERRLPVALPRVEGKRMRFYLVHGKDELRPGYMEIAEPGPDCSPALGRPGPVVTPGLAFGRDGSRIGYGGGYYDRFFAEEPDHLRIAIAYPFQVLETLPCEDWDRKMDRILTGETVISSRSL